ncbi:hypothetical protein ACHAQD_012397 [Fusarium lateritium]
MTHESDWDGTSSSCGSGSYLAPVVHNSRLLLYLPQIIIRPPSQEGKERLSKETGNATKAHPEEPNYFQKIAKRKPHTGPRPLNWVPGLLLVANFIFAAETYRSDIKIRVTYQHAGQTIGTPPTSQPEGHFVTSEERIVVSKVTVPSDKIRLSILTSFHKFSRDAQPDNVASGAPLEAPGDSIHPDGCNVDSLPSLAIRDQKISCNLTLTMSFAAKNHGLSYATGLVVDEKIEVMSFADGRSVFRYLRNETKLEKKVTSSTIYNTSESELVKHSSAKHSYES